MRNQLTIISHIPLRLNFIKKFWIIIVTVIFIGFWIINLRSLNNGSYIVNYGDLKMIDSVVMRSPAIKRGAAKSNGPSEITFEDINQSRFVIRGSRFKSLESQTLFDTLQHTRQVINILTDKSGYKNYFDLKGKDDIEVYDIIICGKSFINLEEVNNAERDRQNFLLIISFIIYVICLTFYFHYKMKD